MKLRPNAIIEFQKIWKKETGEDISHEKAEQEAQNLISLFLLFAKK
jgi:hypothetical protein